mgnify:CR=1 FL=1
MWSFFVVDDVILVVGASFLNIKKNKTMMKLVYKLPILIVEKMGPHFAVGDTCYSFEEDIKTYNPDGKEIVARENEVSALRKTDIKKAYFGCHTDITMPYDELGEITAVRKDGSKITIIKDGRFVLEGTELLNEPLEEI